MAIYTVLAFSVLFVVVVVVCFIGVFCWFDFFFFSLEVGRGKDSTEALHLPVHRFGGRGGLVVVFLFSFVVVFLKCSCTSYHLGTEMAMSKLSHKSKLLGL